MLDREVLGRNAGEYEASRKQQKLSFNQMIIIFIKSTIGLAIFGYHEVYQKSGIWTGIFISILFIYTVIHGSMRLGKFAEEVEEEVEHEGYQTNTYFELVEMMLHSNGKICLSKFLGPATFFMCFFSTIGYMLSTTIALTK